MGVVNTTYTFTGTDTITSSKLNNIIDDTTFTGDAISGSSLQVVSPGKLAVAAGGIRANELASNSVTTAKIADSNVTTAKIANSNVTTVKIADSNVTTAKIADSAVTPAKLAGTAGTKPVQIIQSVKLDTQTITNNSNDWVDVSSLSVTITRVSTTSKHRIEAVINNSSNDNDVGIMFRILRGSTPIGIANSAGSRVRTTSGSGGAAAYTIMTSCVDFIDDTSAVTNASITYKIQARINSEQIGYINRSYFDPDASGYGSRTISTITITELA